MTSPIRICRGCGCTDDLACPGGCSWVLLDFGLVCEEVLPARSGICSVCADVLDWDPALLSSYLCEKAAAVLGPQY